MYSTTTMDVKEANKEIDVKLGSYLRKIRVMNGYRQTEVAKLLGITFQQLQKYESGINRLCISRVVQICNVMNIDIVTFFSGFKPYLGTDNSLKKPNNEVVVSTKGSTKETLDLIKNYNLIQNQSTRKHINRLIKNLSAINMHDGN